MIKDCRCRCPMSKSETVTVNTVASSIYYRQVAAQKIHLIEDKTKCMRFVIVFSGILQKFGGPVAKCT
jgi:hypothetical protein